ncbi:hypothetical protein [Bosea sp. (in: a-proteobacteria)]|uniref:hypothetical protein n=1 Tax=Bosea sp. (in: a-proteobacteria) TaxID=1871050 RepID=UPI001208B7D9|nr:hypothetical protein [Bosea sp. (in: a-proteobacteria)]TAJ26679.1 MAG: hypothetical protein EPO59_24245 [Bosea sp. (in: a-proteobacteria)]
MSHHISTAADAPLAGNSDAPREIDTPRRPGQPGEEAERRPGPNPRSPYPTGPNPPYDPADHGGSAAGKHGDGREDRTEHERLAP